MGDVMCIVLVALAMLSEPRSNLIGAAQSYSVCKGATGKWESMARGVGAGR